MSERDGYQPGVPCWVDTWQPDPQGAVLSVSKVIGRGDPASAREDELGGTEGIYRQASGSVEEQG